MTALQQLLLSRSSWRGRIFGASLMLILLMLVSTNISSNDPFIVVSKTTQSNINISSISPESAHQNINITAISPESAHQNINITSISPESAHQNINITSISPEDSLKPLENKDISNNASLLETKNNASTYTNTTAADKLVKNAIKVEDKLYQLYESENGTISFSKDIGKPTDEQVLTKQRSSILKELEGYKFHPSLGINDLSALIPELGGAPVQNIIVTTWRSGSTFLGDVLQSHPSTFYHYEPLLDFDIKQARTGPLADKAYHNINQLLHCNYTGMDEYLNYGKSHPWLLLHNKRLWWICFVFRDFCERPDFMSAFCKLFPFQSMKVVRMRMELSEHFLRDNSLSVNALLLVRDPRGTMQSRTHREWCPGADDCENPQRLCEDLVSDYYAAKKLIAKYPGRVRVIRYEDLSFNVYNNTRELFDFFRLSYVEQVDNFLQSHTGRSIGGVSSTHRDSKTAPVHWKTDLTFQQVDEIQSKCVEAMGLFGYRVAADEKHLTDLDPIGPFSFPVS